MFGSAVVRVEPDSATLRFSVKSSNPKPGDAIAGARNQSSIVSNLLQRSGISAGGMKTSRVRLMETAAVTQTSNVAYTASIEFNVSVADLERLEGITIGLLDAGVTGLGEPHYQSSKLREARAEARQSAVLAAFKKAELYAEAAGVEIGRVLHIEEVDPSDLSDSESVAWGDFEEFPNVGGYTPSALQFPAATFVSFAIKGGGQPEITGQYRVI